MKFIGKNIYITILAIGKANNDSEYSVGKGSRLVKHVFELFFELYLGI